MTLLELAQAVSASEAAIWQLERGREPNATLLEALGIVLKVDPRFFFDIVADEFTEADCNFRKGATSAERIRKRVLAQGSLFAHVALYLQQRLALPKYNVPQLDAVTAEQIEEAADGCRMYWGLGVDRPIGHMGRVLEHAGVMVTRLRDDETAKLDAFSHRGQDGRLSYVVLNPAKGSSSRTRYDMAHELGHLVLHYGQREISYEEKEAQANQFAAAFLLPRTAVRREFHFRAGRVDFDHVFALKKRWKVSAQAILYRAYDLRLIDAVEFRRAYKMMSARRWIKDEPFEPNEEAPELFRKAVQTLWQRKGFGAERIAADLHWTVQTFENVTGLRSAPAAPSSDNLVSLADRRVHKKA